MTVDVGGRQRDLAQLYVGTVTEGSQVNSVLWHRTELNSDNLMTEAQM
jgi:hypothetical protein